MPHRDPTTGKFVSDDSHGFDDIEVATFGVATGVQAADLNGATGFQGQGDVFEGLAVLDYDEFVDRNESLVLLRATHRMVVFANSTETADGTVLAAAEISADPALSSTTLEAQSQSTASFDDDDVVGDAEQDDSIDLIGRPLLATGHAPFSDGPTGVGGAGTAGVDVVEVTVAPSEFGRFHPRDELFVNGGFRVWNIDDAAVHAQFTGQHVYGVVAD